MTHDDQLPLPFGDATARPSIADRFERFHRENPHVYRLLVRLARDYRRRTGNRKVGIAAVVERARWELALRTSGEDYKINNSYRSYYARLIMAKERDLADAFELRQSQADGEVGRPGGSRAAA